MKVTARMSLGRLWLGLKGELDHHGAKEGMMIIKNRIEELLPRDCVLDLAEVSFMDSSGIAVILRTYKLMHELGGRLWVDNVPKQPMKVIDTAGIERLVGIRALSGKE